MSNLRLPPRLLMVSALSLFATATAAHAQIGPGPGGRYSDGTAIVRSDPRVVEAAAISPRSKDEMNDLSRVRRRDPKRMAGSAISDGRKALRGDPPDYLKAKQLFAYASQLNPGDERAHLGLGDVNLAMRRYPEAVTAYSRAVRVNEKSAEGRYGLGVVYHALGRVDAALDELQVLRTLKKKELAARLEDLLNR